jgi:hypothetical protein
MRGALLTHNRLQVIFPGQVKFGDALIGGHVSAP